MSFAVASAIEPLGERAGQRLFRADFPDGWQQGPGAFGGLVLGTLLRAMQAVEPDAARRPRTLSGELCAPVLVGPAELAVRVLRRGARQTNVACELRQGGEVLATTSAILSLSRPQPDASAVETPPPSGDWRATAIVPAMPAPAYPVFTAHYEYRSDGRGMLELGQPDALGWIRERATLAALDAPAVIGRLDAWWPCVFAFEGRPRPVTTVTFSAQLLCDPATLPADEPLRYRARIAALQDGFFLEARELWRGDRPVAFNQQTFAILK